MKKIRKYANRAMMIFLAVNILLLLTGCGKTESGSQQKVMEEQNQGTEGQDAAGDAQIPGQSQEGDGTQTPGQPQVEGSTQVPGQSQAEDGTQLPGQASEQSQVQDQVVISTKTQEEYEAEKRAERAMFEEKVKEAEGISEEEAVEIAQKAMKADLGKAAEELELSIDETFGWSSELCIADWREIKEEDRGAIAYWINFNNGKKIDDFKNLVNYNCTVNAVDGSILEAYSLQDLGGDTTYYEH